MIAKNIERYASFAVGDLRFIESFQFMNSSLETLVNNFKMKRLQNLFEKKMYTVTITLT